MLKDKLSKTIQKLFTSRCNIINYVNNVDKNGITTTSKMIIAENVSCRVSYSSDTHGMQTNTTDNISQEIKLFITSDIKIKPGSEITVTQNGTTRIYVSSGVPAVYTVHQEIPLVDKEEYA